MDTPDSVGQYRLIEAIGRGAMGTVYRAEDPGNGRQVALKVMAAEMSNDEELVERFRREALAARRLEHPNVTQILDFGEVGQQLFMAMELLEGSDLKSIIESSAPLSLAYKLSIMTQVCSGMAFVHAQGFVHRDLKPGNIHVKPDGQAKIMDFGLVRMGDSTMTRAGMVMGSPSYMSPEQIRGEQADARSDVFALGSVFYELLARRRAFAGKGLAQIMMAVVSGEPEPLSTAAPGVPAVVAYVVARCLAKAPAQRYQGAGELHAALEITQKIFG